MDDPVPVGGGGVRLPRALDDGHLEVSCVGMGTWAWGAPKWGWGTWDKQLTSKSVMAAWDAFVAAGGGLVDTSDDYGGGLSEKLIGEGMRRRNRANVHVATKGSSRPSQLVAAAKASCLRLGIERVSLYQLHSVIEPIDAAADALADIAEQRLAECIGVCNFTITQLERLRKRLAARGVRLASCQAHASLLAQQPFMRGAQQPQQPSLHEWCRQHGVVLIAYAPLASGRLARRIVEQPPCSTRAALTLAPDLVAPDKRGFGAGADVASLAPLLRRLAGGESGDGVPARAALRWLTAHDGVIAIPGCKTAAQVVENLSARRNDVDDVQLAPEQLEALGAAARAITGTRLKR